jgi:hypothetical protein
LDQDRDPAETREWLDALDSVEDFEGIGRIDELLDGIVKAARRKGAKLPFAANTAYVNTISPHDEPAHPGDRAIEHKIRSLIRWNAAAIVLREQNLFRTWRAHRQLPIGGDAVRHWLYAFLACSDRHAWWRPRLLPRSLLAWHLRARISRRALE